MARLILKSPYLKCSGNNSVSGYLRYIGTRERVELLPDDRPPTRKQEQLVRKLVKDFPSSKELGEYLDYESKPTKPNASVFITRALEENWAQVQQSDGYMKYIATRPRAERLGDHGLFSDEDGVNLEQAMRELDHYTGNVWTHIISLKREDAARLGYDNAGAWMNLLRTNRNDIAAAMNIPPNHFRWYAAYHDEGEHPHVHMMAWSTEPGEAYLTREGIRKIKSQLTNQIFKQEMLHTYEQKSQARDELVREARRAIRKLTQEMARSICTEPAIDQKMAQLAGQLETVKGKKSYGYIPKSVKKTVDEVVDRLKEIPAVKACYVQWCALQSEVESYYHDKPREKKKLSQEKEFRQIKNAVIQEAERIRVGEITFEDDDLAEQDEPSSAHCESYACWELQQIIQNKAIPLTDRDQAAEELEQLAGRGDPHAQYLLGQLYRDGPLLIPDSRKAKHWLTQAAKQGLPEAQYTLGKLLLSGDWEVRDTDKGIRWLKQAAENGSHFAAYRLGKEYLEGNTVNKDTTRAADWFTKSAEAGNQYAQYMMGKLHLTGQGLPRDQAQAMMWFSRSAVQGNQYAQFFLEQRNDPHPPSVMLAVTQLLYHMSRIFQDNSVPPAVPMGQQVDRKLRRKIQEKKIAMGHKPDDYEEQWPEMTM
ncbi:MobP3 family relaxase [Pseudoflavonifractor phocaeensis]|uniref:MobP3 family relaxase n=1 Tax=Pseudoflavonifractor phocaeensis TaxID=1870988 RepID=UPI0025A36EDF|nr:MobP3 family relaxase [Pseudoflavonifractor phocaeensis]MDM8237584.1 MobP3 family relaxase [Pseudoflavonifractor phocaeensis]